MKFIIDQRIFDKFPDLNIGVLVAYGINNNGENKEILKLLREQSKIIKSKFSLEKLPNHPRIQPWRKAFSSFGAKPKKHRSSIENLYRMILKGVELRSINKVVDIYNYISLKYMIPVGGDDIDKVDGDIRLTFASGDEQFVQLNSDVVKNPRKGEIVYVDDKEVLCRRWNWRECDKSKMTEDTKNIMLVSEGLPPVGENDIKDAINEMADMIINYCGGETQIYTLNQNNNEITL